MARQDRIVCMKLLVKGILHGIDALFVSHDNALQYVKERDKNSAGYSRWDIIRLQHGFAP